MKEPTGNTEAELQYWQKRALDAEDEITELVNDLRHAHNTIMYLRGQLENERYNDCERYDD
jgi:predicted  nucleic acid-binding Zn-ribbon protein